MQVPSFRSRGFAPESAAVNVAAFVIAVSCLKKRVNEERKMKQMDWSDLPSRGRGGRFIFNSLLLLVVMLMWTEISFFSRQQQMHRMRHADAQDEARRCTAKGTRHEA